MPNQNYAQVFRGLLPLGPDSARESNYPRKMRPSSGRHQREPFVSATLNPRSNWIATYRHRPFARRPEISLNPTTTVPLGRLRLTSRGAPPLPLPPPSPPATPRCNSHRLQRDPITFFRLPRSFVVLFSRGVIKVLIRPRAYAGDPNPPSPPVRGRGRRFELTIAHRQIKASASFGIAEGLALITG